MGANDARAGHFGAPSLRASRHRPGRDASAPRIAPRSSTLDAGGQDAEHARDAPRRPGNEDAGLSRLYLDKPIELGRAKSLAAIGNGVLLRTKIDELIYRPFERPKRESDAAVVDEETLSVLPAPVIARNARAYWISKGRLVRREFRHEGGEVAIAPLEELASDAYDATRAAVWTVETSPPRDVVAYIARPSFPRLDRHARLWVEDGADDTSHAGRIYDLSDEASGASSVALIGEPERVWAVSLDARVAMCPVHARAIELAESGPPEMGDDVVVYVGEPQPSHTEISAALWEHDPLTILPLPRYAGGFGLVLVPFGWEPQLDSSAFWTMYPAGLDRALTATFEACNEVWVAYVRPKDETQGAGRLLAAAPLESAGTRLGRETILAEAKRFLSLSFARADAVRAPRQRVGWVAWSADGAAWARAVRCP